MDYGTLQNGIPGCGIQLPLCSKVIGEMTQLSYDLCCLKLQRTKLQR